MTYMLEVRKLEMGPIVKEPQPLLSCQCIHVWFVNFLVNSLFVRIAHPYGRIERREWKDKKNSDGSIETFTVDSQNTDIFYLCFHSLHFSVNL